MKNILLFSVLVILGLLSVSSGDLSAGLTQNNHLTNSPDSMLVCIVTGEEFPAEHGVTYKYLNREVKFCCKGCEKAFAKEPASYLKDGLRCPVCDEDDAMKDISNVNEGVKYYFCGNGCKTKFEKDPQTYLNHYAK